MNALFDVAPFHDPVAAKAALAMFQFDDGYDSYWFFATKEDEARRLFREHRVYLGCPLLENEEETEVRLTEEPLLKVLDFWVDSPSKVVATKTVAEWISTAQGPGFWGSTVF